MNYEEVFSQLPINCLLLDTKLKIINASQSFYTLSGSDKSIIGKYIFEPFPMNEYTKQSNPEKNHLDSLKLVVTNKVHDRMPIQRYDLKLPDEQGGNFISKWWQIDNYPILNESGDVDYVLKVFEDVSHMIDNIHNIDEAIAKSIFNQKS